MGAQMAISARPGPDDFAVGTAVLNDVTESERGIAAALILVLRLVA